MLTSKSPFLRRKRKFHERLAMFVGLFLTLELLQTYHLTIPWEKKSRFGFDNRVFTLQQFSVFGIGVE